MRWVQIKQVLLGRPLATAEQDHQLLRKLLALPLFSSDPLSSVAYATQEMMLVLAAVGATGFVAVRPLSIAVAALLFVVVVSYRQTVRAYPNGGGSFIVTTDNLGLALGTIAAAALLTDYVLTVAVSVSAGVAAITSALPGLVDWRVPMALGFVALLTFINLRGAKESSAVFAAPTYLFVMTIMVLIVAGLIRCTASGCGAGETLAAASSGIPIEAAMPGLTLFLILRAFASGSTALTGVEAIADGVQAFREPRAKNAAVTLAAMGAIAITMFIGISMLSVWLDVRICEDHPAEVQCLATEAEYGTVLSQVGRAVFGGGFVFYALQIFTAAVLVLAANTAYADFPRLSAILANHRLMPRQFRNRGDRLVFSNGVLVLAVLASVLILSFRAEVTRLIQLYVIGVFTSFTLSQAGMVRRWWRLKEPGWRRSAVVNGIGAIVTGVVLVVVSIVKFSRGAWIVLIAVPLLVWMMRAIRRHYLAVATQLKQIPVEAILKANRVIVCVAPLDPSTDRAVAYAKLIRSDSVTALHALEESSDELIHAWDRLHPDLPLNLVDGEDDPVAGRLLEFIRNERDQHPEATITVVLSERFRNRSQLNLVRHPHVLLVKTRLLFEPGVVVTDLTFTQRRRRSGISPAPLQRLETVVIVSDLTRPVREALVYAAGLGAPVRCVHVDVDDAQRDRLLRAWDSAPFPFSLEVVPSPYRGITRPLISYLRRVRQMALPGTLVNAVLPEFIVPGRIGQLLHNQTGLAIKASLIPEPWVAVTSVPFHLKPAIEAERATASG